MLEFILISFMIFAYRNSLVNAKKENKKKEKKRKRQSKPKFSRQILEIGDVYFVKLVPIFTDLIK